LALTVTILGNDPAVLSLLGESLSTLGYQVSKDLEGEIHAVVIDEPDQSTFIDCVKAFDQTLPILVLSPQKNAAAEVTLPKPLRVMTLATELEAMVERNGQRVGSWRFFPKIRLLKGPEGQSDYLTQKESDLLDYLIQAGRLVTRDELLTDVFGYNAQISTHTVETHIHTLRKKLGSDLVITEEAGYRLAL